MGARNVSVVIEYRASDPAPDAAEMRAIRSAEYLRQRALLIAAATIAATMRGGMRVSRVNYSLRSQMFR